ncbi:MAG TPA: sigma 54-interacting transcriptional regulator [Bryobacteraceae bacterium]|nr:sigma 54-interacting transcriptional regulator [Bryobacteraceae bacterium]
MNHRLVARDGPLKGSVFPLDGGEFSVGRNPSNRLAVSDPSLSRQHCVIARRGEQFEIRDLDSRNGTFVNGVPVHERRLTAGDEIQIGNSLFLFLSEDTQTAPNPAVRLDERSVLTGSTVILRSEDSRYLQPDNVATAPFPALRVARDLKALLKLSTAINSVRRLETLERQLMECIFEVVPASRGAILLTGDNPDEFSSVFSWDRESGAIAPFPVSGTVVRKVLEEKVGVLSTDVMEDAALGGSKSLLAAETRSLLAVPLNVFERMLGLIYLDTGSPTAKLDQDHLELMTAVAAISAVALENARHVERLEDENQRLKAEINIEHNMVGESQPMRTVYRFVSRVAASDSTVLITGESGTGKELVARAIHRNSPRVQKPFVAINCAALTETLLESELFGHEKGAFTGALQQKRGKLEVADGGTVFLDEMGELAPSLQAKLLRALQEREFERVGGTRAVHIDVRVIAATNRDLAESVKAGTFRQDLYYRLNVVSIEMPPLRERREDIPLLASYFAARAGERSKRRILGVSPEARACLVNYEWPGNVRELENAVERAVVLGSSDFILPEDLPEAVLETVQPAGVNIAQYHEAVSQAKKQVILRAVEQAGGSYTEAAKLLGVHPNYLHRLIRNMNLKSVLKGAG